MTNYKPKPTTIIKKALTEVNKIKKSYCEGDITFKVLIKDIRDIWSKCLSINENWNILQTVASKYNNPSDQSHIQTNLYIINRLYNTNVKNLEILTKIARVISNQKIDFQNTPNALKKYNTIIKKCGDEFRYRPYSLLSKYYAVMEPTAFPIKDSLAIKSLNFFLDPLLLDNYKTPYTEYINVIDKFIRDNDLDLDYRELDKFLWLYGMTL